jgi:hypothetical protein
MLHISKEKNRPDINRSAFLFTTYRSISLAGPPCSVAVAAPFRNVRPVVEFGPRGIVFTLPFYTDIFRARGGFFVFTGK